MSDSPHMPHLLEVQQGSSDVATSKRRRFKEWRCYYYSKYTRISVQAALAGMSAKIGSSREHRTDKRPSGAHNLE